jgi:hypothetical protein
MREMMKKRRAQDAEELEAAKREAIAAGKEEFDLDKFDKLYVSPVKSELNRSREQRIQDWESEYYTVRGRRVNTVKEFAEVMRYNDSHWE